MIDIKRINELAKKSKTVGLTDEEKEEQTKLRKEYVQSVVGDLRAQLDNTYVLDKNENKVKLIDYNKAEEAEEKEAESEEKNDEKSN
ncbi:MAG TPA: DUF896 family protein [Clostridiales bacterium]|nr:DUF896 family protein [Clostridiales bacterium]HCH92186.1 DUF896 family protein [Clostridiales bacterium]